LTDSAEGNHAKALSKMQARLDSMFSEQQQLRGQLMTTVSTQRAELEQGLVQHVGLEMAKERERWNVWAHHLWNEHIPSEISSQQQQIQRYLESHLESRLCEEISKIVAEMTQRTDEQVHRLDQMTGAAFSKEQMAGAALQESLVDVLKKSASQTRVMLQQQLKAQLASQVTTGLSGLQQQLSSELAALREQQHKDLIVEVGKYQDSWKPPAEQASAGQFVSWADNAPASIGFLDSKSVVSTEDVCLASNPHSTVGSGKGMDRRWTEKMTILNKRFRQPSPATRDS